VLDASQAIAPSVDLERPSVARVYDYLLGGASNWAIDRVFAQRILRKFPLFKDIARANRMFVNRVVRHLARLGVRQFLDVGSGIFSTGNTHQVLDEVATGTRVIYVDNEPMTVAHAEVLLEEVGDRRRHAILQADLRRPDALWSDALDTGLLDLDEPVAVLMFSVLHVIEPAPDGDDMAARSIARYRDLLPAGSYLGISHVTDEGIPDELRPKLRTLKELCDLSCASKVYCRSRASIDAFLGDFKRIEPGMVWTPAWHPEAEPDPVRLASPGHAVVWAGVGQKLG
jgi:hypothetical protein